MKSTRSAFLTAFAAIALSLASAAIAQTQITFQTTLGGEDGGFMDAIVAEFNATHPDIEVTHLVVVDSLEYKLNLSTGIAAGTAPNVLFMRKFDMPMFLPHLRTFTPAELLERGIDVDDVYPGLKEGLVVDGTVYGVPLDAWIFYLAYNRGNWTEAGLDPDSPPTDRDEWMAAMEALKAITPEGITPYYESPDWAWIFVHLLWQFGGDLLTDDFREPAFQEAGAAALHLMMEMQDAGYLPTSQVDAGPPFLSGDASALITGIWTIMPWADALGEDFGAAVAPQLGTHRAVFGGTHVLAFPEVMMRDPAAADAALTWASYLWENALEWYAAGQTPGRISIAESDEFRTRLPNVHAVAQQLPDVKTFQFFEYINEIVDEIGVYTQQVLLLRALTPEDAMSRAADAVSEILADYWATQ